MQDLDRIDHETRRRLTDRRPLFTDSDQFGEFSQEGRSGSLGAWLLFWAGVGAAMWLVIVYALLG